MSKDDGKSKLSEKLAAIQWGLKLAWKIDKRMLFLWGGLSVLLAVLPSIALIFNQRSLEILSGFLAGQPYVFADVVPAILSLGILLTLVGLSARVNNDLIYMMMFDSYYFGMEEVLTDAIQRIQLEDLLKKEINDEYNYIVWRVGSLTDLASGLCDILNKTVSILSLLVVAFSASKLVFFISIVYVVFVFFLNFKVTDKVRFNTVLNRNESRITNYYENLSANVGAAKETRIFGSADQIVSQWGEHYGKVQQAQCQRSAARELTRFISGMGFYLFMIVMVTASLFGVSRGTMATDIFLLVFTLCLNLFNATSALPRSIQSFDYGLFALERQRRFFNTAPIQDPQEEQSKADTPADPETIYQADHLTFRYGTGQAAVDDVSFTIKKGDVVALIGPNGSGKTTLVKLLANMFTPSSGTLQFFGRPIKSYKSNFVRSKTSVFFQDFFLFHQSLRVNIGAGNIEELNNTPRILEAVKKGGAEKLLNSLPKGLDTLVNKNIDKSGVVFSGGERQRIGAARTHMSDKDVLIFDEPAAALDPIAELEQFMNIREMIDGRTAILISHRIGFARLASKIIVMDHGKIAESGTHEELMKLGGLYAEMFRQQAEWYDTKSGEVDL